MRTALTRTFVGAATVFAIGAGSLAGATVSSAASEPAARPAAGTQEVSVLAVNNLGLTVGRAKSWQCFMTRSGYEPWEHAGHLGTDSWKAAQRMFNARGFSGKSKLVVDGVVGPLTIKALQRFLNDFGFGLAVDGIAGKRTTAAFYEFNGVPMPNDPRC
ncbi:peptidoglycan-binding domain-containing protein [Streptomyces olivaceus]|uniref:peptidoglycan-binding domain-containing protein n=1 Tax=Streptomyces olivaceus TaxID=47716 RepID=UPI001CCB7675|nr:peptidoglycan-binding domain-containing protein [Streptomyces olivaceus]MBZ6202041.1 peptidoglycan-binding protein [Streptomyces olivaceus]